MKPKLKKKDVIIKEENYADMDEKEINKRLFPGLAMPNDPQIKVRICGSVSWVKSGKIFAQYYKLENTFKKPEPES